MSAAKRALLAKAVALRDRGALFDPADAGFGAMGSVDFRGSNNTLSGFGSMGIGTIDGTPPSLVVTNLPAGARVRFNRGNFLNMAGAGRDAQNGLGGAGIDAQLEVRGLNLRAMHRALHPTDLVGTVGLVRSGQSDALSVDLTQRGMRLSARARHEGETLTVHEALLQAGAGRVQAQGALTLTSAQPFTLTARLTRVNPADFGAFPAASVNGTVEIDGALQPQWQARTRYVLQDSVWRGYRLSGAGRLQVSPQGARDIDARVALGRNALQAEGAFGAQGDLLRFSIQAPALGALGEAWSGAVEARGTLGGTLARPAVDVTVNARDVRMPGDHRVAALTGKASVDAAPDPRLRLDADARALRIAGTDIESVMLQVDGLRSGHSVSLHAVREGIDLQASARGGFDAQWTRWLGRIDSLENRGTEAFRLAQPAALSVSRQGLALGAAQVDWAGGKITLQDTVYTAQNIRSGGSVTGLPARKLLRLAGIDRGWRNDVVLGARWTLEAAQQVNGRIEVFRESGDLVAQSDDQQLALGIERLDLAVDIVQNDKSPWDAPQSFWQTLGKLAEKHGLTWGGRWKFLDLPHSQWSGAPISPTALDVALAQEQGIEAVQRKYGAL